MKLKKNRLTEILSNSTIQLFLIIWAIVQMYPIIWMIYSSFKKSHQILTQPFALPTALQFENYKIIWDNPTGINLIVFFKNSVIVTVFSLVLLLFISILAAWAIAKYNFFGKNFLLIFLILMISIPIHGYIVGLYFLIIKLNLLNNYLGLIFSYSAIFFPFTVVLLQAYFKGFPDEIIEAARIDGCSEIRIIYRIVVPVSKGAIIAATVINFIAIWNEFFLSLIVLRKNSLQTLMVGLFQFKGNWSVEWGYMFAGLVFTIIAPLVVYAVLSRQILEGMTLGAVKE